ncbi:hypothetical protein [Edwardsiella piscicida]|uniref:hypothetical protein n=1 Tax=Edwardsiella piscicida TaxID=1263550 RepID=UPI00370D5351
MTTITKERMKEIRDLDTCVALEESAELARIALASLDADASENSVHDLFLRAKALMYQSGGSPIEHSLNPVDAWLFDAERVGTLKATGE